MNMKNLFLILVSVMLLLSFTNLGLAQPFPYTEDFENGGSIPAGWTNDPFDSGKDWDFGTSAGHGANFDHTTGSGYLAYVDDSSPSYTDPTNLLTPAFDITGLTSPELVFWYWSFNDRSTPQDTAYLHIDVWDGSMWHLDVIDSIGQEAEEWRSKVVDLTPYKSASTKIRFRVVETPSFYHDIGIDDVTIREMPTGPVFSVAPDTGDFGTVLLGDTSSFQTFTVTNTGIGTLTIDPAPSITGTDAGEFFLSDTNTYPVNLNAGESIMLDVAFAPTSGGSKTANLTITDNTTDAVHNVPLLGQGFDPTVTTYPYTQDFENGGTIPLGWINDDTDSGKDWDFDTDAGHGADFDHTTGSGYLAYVDDSSPSYTDPTNLITPPLDITGLTSPEIVFWYWSFNDRTTPVDTAYLHIDVWDGSMWHLDVIDSIGQEAEEWRSKVVDLTAYQSASTRVRFRVIETPSFYHDIGIDDVTIREMPSAPIFSISPDSADFGTVVIGNTSSFETFTITNTGAGTLTIDPAPSITGTDASEFVLSDPNTYPVNLNAGESTTLDVAFAPTSGGAKTANLTITDNTAEAVHNVPLMGQGFDPTVTTYPYVQDFDAFPSGITSGHIAEGWSNPAVGDSGDWTVRSGSTPSSGTGPSGDHTSGTGQYLFTEASSGGNPGNPNQSAYLVSPPLDLTALSAPSLSFWYHMFGDDMGELHVDVWDGSIWNMDIIPPIVGNQGDMWFKQIASLTAFSGTINIRFRGITGSGFESDMAVDDVLVDEAQPDLAVTQFIGFPAFAPGSSTVNFDVEVSNVGATPTPGTILDISLNGSPSSSHSVSALTSGQSDTISTSITTSASGTDIVTAALQAIPNDANLSNDTLSANLNILAPIPIPFIEIWNSTTFDTQRWPEIVGSPEIIDSTGVSTGTFPYPVPSEPYFLSVKGDPVEVTSGFFDLTGLMDYAVVLWESEHDLEPPESVALEYYSNGGTWEMLHLFEGTNNGFGLFEPFEQMAFGLPTDAYHSSFRFRFRGDGLESTDEWFFDDIQLISADSLPSDVASTNIVDATYLTKMPLSQASLVSSITYTGDYSNLGPVNTGDVNLSIKDSSGITVFSDAINGVTLNALEDTSFTFNSWDASGTSTNIYDVATYTSSFTDTDASNDTATTSIELSNAMAYDDGNHTSNVAIIPTDRSVLGTRFTLTDNDNLTGVEMLITSSTTATDSFSIDLFTAQADTPSTMIARIFRGAYGDLGPLPVLARFIISPALPLPAGDFFILIDSDSTGNANYPLGCSSTGPGAQNIPHRFGGYSPGFQGGDWLWFEEAPNTVFHSFTPIIRALFPGNPIPIHDLAAFDLSVQSCLSVDDTVTVTAKVINVGNQSETNVPVALREDGIVVSTTNVSLNPGESTTVTFSYTPSDTGVVLVEVESQLPSDVDASNDLVGAYVRVADSGTQIVFQDDFEDPNFTFSNWVIMDDPTSTNTWMIFPPPYPNAYTLPITSRGNVFSADADEAGSGSITITTAMISLDLSAHDSLQLDFDSDFNAMDDQDTSRVSVSNDGGATWTTVLEWVGPTDVRNIHATLDLTPYLANSANAVIAFESIQPGWDWWWTIDNVCVSAIAPPCTPGFLGDIDGNDLVNSTDALVALSFDAGLPLPQPFLDRIAIGFGDVNEDGATNSTDALIILSYDAGIPTPFPVGDPVCLPDNNKRTKANSAVVPKEGESIIVSALPSVEITPKATIDIPVVIDMSKTSEILGSYTATLEWNPDVFELVDYRGGTATGFDNPVVNDNAVEEGKLTFAHAYPYGADGKVNILNVHMKVSGKEGSNSALSLSFNAMAAAKTFTDLLPFVTQTDAEDLMVEAPLTYGLSNYPNPFNPSTDIRYSLPEAGEVEIVIYNVLGQKVRTLVDGRKEAGNYMVSWQGMNDNGQSLPSGMYFLRMKAGKFTADRKLLFLK